ncbi:MAG: tetratricopeptide repeat protein [Methanoregulaceae archaeon]|nr:tetratricopeptide repeat protein [Methanoregulaceae archaeon]
MSPEPRTVLCVALLLCLILGQACATDSQTWFGRGTEFVDKGDYSSAIDAFQNAVSLDPGYLNAWISLAYVYVQANRMTDAADAYRHALTIEPDNTVALKGLGYVYSRQGKDADALDAFNRAIAVNPGDSSSWLQKGLTLSALGRLNESIPVYQKVIELSPDDFDAWLCMGLDYYSGGNYQAALDAFEHATDLDQRSDIAWRYKGDTLSHLGRNQEAIEAYNRGLIVAPGNAEMLQGKYAAESALRSYLGGNASPAQAASETRRPYQGIPLLIGMIVVASAGIGYFYYRRKKGPVQAGKAGVVLPSPSLAGRDRTEAGGEGMGTHHDVFVSYSSKDKAVADATCAYLESRGIRCWIAPRDVLPGSNYPRAIVEAIDGSRVMVLVFSSNSNSSNHVVRELTHAVSKGVVILPFRIEDIQPSKDMEYLIGIPHWLDALTPPLDRHLTHLAETVEILLRTRNGSGQNPSPPSGDR